jgi:hypothetical protein
MLKRQREVKVSGKSFLINVVYGLFENEMLYETSVDCFPDLFDYAASEDDAVDLIKDSIATTLSIDLSEKAL